MANESPASVLVDELGNILQVSSNAAGIIRIESRDEKVAMVLYQILNELKTMNLHLQAMTDLNK